MLDWMNKLGPQPDHPLRNTTEAARLVAGLPADPGQALVALAGWLALLTATTDVRLQDRVAVARLLDEAGQPFDRRATHLSLHSGTPDAPGQLPLWQPLWRFWASQVAAYGRCVDELAQDAKPGAARAEALPVMIARGLRGIGHLLRLSGLRKLPLEAQYWQALCRLYTTAESATCEVTRVKIYAEDPLPAAPRHEFARVLMLESAAPETLTPARMELAARVVARFGDAFQLHASPGPGCIGSIDLAASDPPCRWSGAAPKQPSHRFFGAGAVPARIADIIRRLVESPEEKEKRFGDDYSSDEKLVVLRHLLLYWGDAPPPRQNAVR